MAAIKPNTKKMNKAIWISYDFGLRGDYQGLYAWLDTHQALECGQGLAFIKFKTDKSISSKDLMTEVLNDLKQSVNLNKTDRIYLVCKDSSNDKIKGDFMNGGRRAAPWEGYGDLRVRNNEDEGE